MSDNETSESTSDAEEKDLEARVEKIMGDSAEPQPTPQPANPHPVPVSKAPTSATPEPKKPAPTPAESQDSLDKLVSEIDENDDSQIGGQEHHLPAPDPSIREALAAQEEQKPKVTKAIDLSALGPSDDSGKSSGSASSSMAVVMKDHWYVRFGRLFKSKWLWLTILIIVAAGLGLPQTRYLILGKFLQPTVTVDITDSKTKSPVSDATVSIGNASAVTNASGQAVFKAPLGKQSMSISKQYYETYSASEFVGLKPATVHVHLMATGRQVPVTVLNKISGGPVAGAEVHVLNTSAKTNSKGMAYLVLPTNATYDAATVTLPGFNSLTTTIEVTSSQTTANDFSIVPSAQLYYLSDASGTLNVVKSDLDGSDMQTVLAGTGKENLNNTVLVASSDWQYLALISDRSGSPGVYVINTANGKATEIDGSNADFTPVGWYGHSLVYDEVLAAIGPWQDGHELLKSYNADTNQSLTLDQAQGNGTSAQYASQSFSTFFIQSGAVVYNTYWSGTASDYPSGAADTLRTVTTTNQGKKDLQTQQPGSVTNVSAVLGSPVSIDFSYTEHNSSTPVYYEYTKQAVGSATNLNASLFSPPAPSYLFSPSGNQTFWGVAENGKTNLLVGNASGENSKAIINLGSYLPYGWISNNYLVVTKNGELFVMPANGLISGHQPLLVSAYYQSPLQYPNIEYSYGAL